jgi:hypothetical protein
LIFVNLHRMWRRLYDRVPERYRLWVKVLVAVFIALEAWRALAIGLTLFPWWQAQAAQQAGFISKYPWWQSAVGLALAILIIAVTMAVGVRIFRKVWKGRAAEGTMPGASVPRPFR